MNGYELILKKDNVKLLKKKNEFKLELNSKISNNKIIKHFKNNKIFKILKELNEKIINNVEIVDDNITLILNNLFQDSDDEETGNLDLSYLSFNKNIISESENSILIESKNTPYIFNDKYNKITFNTLNFNVEIKNNELNMIIILKFDNNKYEIHKQHILGMIICKMFSKLIRYYDYANQH